jgi:hypothetical protein
VYFQDTTAGSSTITAAAAGKQGAGQTETVSPASVSRIAVSPSSATVSAGASRAFAATGYDAYGNVVAVTPAWSVSTGTPGAIGPSGVFTAGARSGSGAVVATAGTLTASAPVTVPTDARVGAIAYSATLVSATLVNAAGAAIPNAQIALSVYRNGVLYAQRTATTGPGGMARASVSTNPAGCYTTTVTNVSALGWDGKTPANKYCK